MISVTKIFRFETAHAIFGYEGPCKHIHGHSYVLHVTVASPSAGKEDFIRKPGFVVDFKILKKIVQEAVVLKLDHRLILSKEYLESKPALKNEANLEVWEIEPSSREHFNFQQNGNKPGFTFRHSVSQITTLRNCRFLCRMATVIEKVFKINLQ